MQRAADEVAAALGEKPERRVEVVVVGHERDPLVVREHDVLGVPAGIGVVEERMDADARRPAS